MELKQEILTIKEIFELIRNEFDLGEMAEFGTSYGGTYASEIRGDNLKLKDKDDLKGLVEKLIDDYVNPLEELIENKTVLEEYKIQLKLFFSNLDYNMKLLSILPGKSLQKSALIYLISNKALEIYYETKFNGKYENNPINKEKYIRYEGKKILPFDVAGVPNSLKGLVLEKQKKMYSLFGKKAASYNKDLGSSMSARTIMKTRKQELETINSFYTEIFFKRPQWRAYNQLKKIKHGDKIFEVLPALIDKLFTLEKELSFEEFIELFINEIFKDTENISQEKKQEVLKFIKQTTKLYENPEALLKASEPLNLFLYPLKLKSRVSLKKLQDNKVHRKLIIIQDEYNDLKNNYVLKKHISIYENLVINYKNSEIVAEQRYYNYFISDSTVLLDLIMKDDKERNEIIEFQEQLKRLKVYRNTNYKWTGKKLTYLDYILNSMLFTQEEISPNFMEVAILLKTFGTDEAIAEAKESLELYAHNMKTLINK